MLHVFAPLCCHPVHMGRACCAAVVARSTQWAIPVIGVPKQAPPAAHLNSVVNRAGMLSLQVRKSIGAIVLYVDLMFDAGVTTVVGPSGAGKSTMLRLIAGLTRPDSGEIPAWRDGAGRRSSTVPSRAWTAARRTCLSGIRAVSAPHGCPERRVWSGSPGACADAPGGPGLA